MTKYSTGDSVKHRIRAAAILTKGDRVLLVQHVHPVIHNEWWVPPGGGLEPSDGSVFECAKREVFEETGLVAEISRIIYIREFADLENLAHNIEIFLLADGFSGELSTKNIQGNGPDEHFIRDVRWVSRDEIQSLVVYPEILKNSFWIDRDMHFPEIRYLGVQAG
jgi:8-oxo-dGTP diphosphatase